MGTLARWGRGDAAPPPTMEGTEEPSISARAVSPRLASRNPPTAWDPSVGTCAMAMWPGRTKSCPKDAGHETKAVAQHARARTSGFEGRWRRPVFRPRQMPRRREARGRGSSAPSMVGGGAASPRPHRREVRAVSGADSRTYLTRRARRLRRRTRRQPAGCGGCGGADYGPFAEGRTVPPEPARVFPSHTANGIHSGTVPGPVVFFLDLAQNSA